MPSTNYGRHLIPHPDFNSPISGNNVHTEVITGIAKISDNITGRWSGIQSTLNNGASISFTHNFNLSSDGLIVLVQEGTTLLDIATAFTSRYTVSYPDVNNVTVTNASGGAISNVSVYVFPRRWTRIDTLELSPISNNQSGTAITLTTPTTGLTRLVNASLVSITNITAPSRGYFFAMFNDTGVGVTIINDSGGTAANRILTGTGANIVLSAGASLLLFYDTTEQRWLVVGGAGSGGNTVQSDVVLVSSGNTVPGIVSGNNVVRIGRSDAAADMSTAPFSTTPLDGTQVTLIGGASTFPVTFLVSDTAGGFVGNGDCQLNRYSTLKLVYNAAFNRWIEVSRTIVGGL